MSQNTENIEAKLCAYVDGDLDEAGRREIEKHLQSNPQHRLLLEELRQTKVMMQSLPREVAPPELAETLHGQLERSVLLDGVGTGDVGATMRINRWPQLMAVAAVVLLALGLGVLVYVVLPKHSSETVAFKEAPKSNTEALVRRDATKEVADDAPPGGREELGPLAGKIEADALPKLANNPVIAEMTKNAEPDVFAKKSGDVSKDLILGEGGAGSGGMSITGKGAAAKSKSGELEEGSAVAVADTGAASSPRRVYVVLSTDNLAATNGHVAGYLASNKIAWQPADQAVQAAFLSDREISLGARLNRTEFQLRNAERNLNRGNDSLAGNLLDPFNLPGNDSRFSATAPGKPAEQKSDNTDNRAQTAQQQSQRQFDLDRGYHDNQVGRATTQPAMSEPQPSLVQQQQLASQQQIAPPSAGPAEQVKQLEPSYNLAESKTENVIIARGLTREQAAMVCDSLGKLYAGQTAVVVDHNALDAMQPALLKHLVKEADGQRSVVQPQSGLNAATEVADSSSEDPRLGSRRPSSTPVAGQAQVAPPATLPSAAPADLNRAVADGDEVRRKSWAQDPAEQMLMPAPGSKDDPATSRPAPDLTLTTRPVDPTAPLVQAAQPMPVQAGAMDLNALPATRPAEEKLEVVIVVQPVNVPPASAMPEPPVQTPVVGAPNAAPSTQPADAAINAK